MTSTSQISLVVQQLLNAVLVQKSAGLSDGQLLGQFIYRRDEAAFAALVKRHGPMVWGVCRRLLRNHQDAENAFQATFLVLVRKARSVAPREMVANWLYGVAQRTALNARAAAARRRSRERQVSRMPEPAVGPERPDDVLDVLDEQISRLPPKYRAVIVLCELEGKTRHEASRQLGCPEGTVASRLATARSLLAKRLRRQGVAVATGTLAALLSPEASAGVPASVVSSAIKMSRMFAAGQAVAPAKVVALAEGVLKVMLLKKLKAVTALVFFAGLLSAVPVWRSGPAIAGARTENSPQTLVGRGQTHAKADEVQTTLAEMKAARTALLQAKQRLDEAHDRFVAAKRRYETARDRGKPKPPWTEKAILRVVHPGARTVDVEVEWVLKFPDNLLWNWGPLGIKGGYSYKTEPVTENATILQDNVKTPLASLKRGSHVTLTFDPDHKRVVGIAANGGTVRGGLLSVNEDRHTVSVTTDKKGERRTYHVVRETEVVTGDGKRCRLRDLQAGGTLLLTLSVEDPNTAIRIEPAPTDDQDGS